MKEVWKDAEGYEGLYSISNFGKVKGLKSNKILSLNRLNADGYIHVALRKDGKPAEFMLHRLVAENFIERPEEKNKFSVNHIDGVKTNNRTDNLEWISLSGQMKHAYKLGLKKPKKGCLVLTDDQMDEIKKEYKRYKKGFGSVALANKYGVESTTILRVVKGHFD